MSESPLRSLLDRYRAASLTPREQGTYFEELIVCYLRHEPAYRELYREVLTFSEWAKRQGLDQRDVGIDLVALTFTDEVHAIQCKLYPSEYRLLKGDIDSFFTASGKRPFTHRVVVSTTEQWSEHAEDALRDQQVPVTKVDLAALENSAIDWSRFSPRAAPTLKAKKQLRPHQRDAVAVVRRGLETRDRGKLIMACGTGKTFTSLKFAEASAGAGKRVLFLVPSLALLSQSLTEWTQESGLGLRSFAVCSDSDVGKKRKKAAIRLQPGQGAATHPPRPQLQRLPRVQRRGARAGRAARRLRAGPRVRRPRRGAAAPDGQAAPCGEHALRQRQGQDGHSLQRLLHGSRHPARLLRFLGEQQARDRVGDGAAGRVYRQGQRHREGRERLATETVGDPRYPLSLLLRVITVSIRTNQIVRALPALELMEEIVSDSGAAT